MIDFITDKNKFEEYTLMYSNLFKKNMTFEENIFQDRFKYYLGFEFDFIFHKSFFERLKQFILEIEEKNVIFYVTDPSPEDFYYKNFKKYNTLDINVKTTNEELSKIMMDNSVDELALYSNDIFWFSSSNEWAIAASRDWEIAIVGFTSLNIKEKFLKSFGESADMFTTIEDQVKGLDEMLHFNDDIKNQYNKLVENYQDRN